ncbi:MAG: KilA-N domain-containing protein [Bacteroidetes bacterium]|nr:MAG: KilA-N domain-containing protein [Bacteroidota bacterium]
MKSTKIIIEGTEIVLFKKNESDYISITDIAKYKDRERTDHIIQNWMRTRNTIEFIGMWEQLHNPNFKPLEFEGFKNEAGANSFSLTPKRWIETTNAIGIISKAGRYGGTYAHKDIAFEFGSWISPTFKLYLITEYQRLKEIETNQYNLEWNVKRIISKANYHIHTDAIKKHIIPQSDYTKNTEWIVYAEEADLLNVALFGCAAKQWRDANSDHADKGLNIRDFASINELAVLSNMETINAELIKNSVNKEIRFHQLREIAQYQVNILNSKDYLKTIKRISETSYIDEQKRLKK